MMKNRTQWVNVYWGRNFLKKQKVLNQGVKWD
jgi:hypothetical protein